MYMLSISLPYCDRIRFGVDEVIDFFAIIGSSDVFH